MKFLGLCGVLLAAWLAIGSAKAQETAAVKELIPTGKLRFGVAFAPKMSALFVVKDAGGSPRGVTADLGNELAQRLGVPIEFMVAPEFPGSHIVDGGFQQTGIAIAVPKGHPEALAYVTKFMEDAKASGSVRRAMDRAGMANLAVAPPER